MEKSRTGICPQCAIQWVDRAIAASGVEVTEAERRQLIAALLARRHLLLTGPEGAGKRRLARALADALVEDRTDRVRVLRGHPWWAAQTGDVNRFVAAQENYNMWRLEDFVTNMVLTISETHHPNKAAQPPFVVIIENMSPVEADYYFGSFLKEWISFVSQAKFAERFMLMGTLNTPQSLNLSAEARKLVATVNLKSHYDRKADGSRNSNSLANARALLLQWDGDIQLRRP